MMRDRKSCNTDCALKEVLKNHIVSANHRKIFAWAHNLGTANQSRQEAIQLFEVHRVLIVKATKNPAKALEFGGGQWLWFHGKPLIVRQFNHCGRPKSLSLLRGAAYCFCVWIGFTAAVALAAGTWRRRPSLGWLNVELSLPIFRLALAVFIPWRGAAGLTGARDGTRADGVLDRGRRRLFSTKKRLSE